MGIYKRAQLALLVGLLLISTGCFGLQFSGSGSSPAPVGSLPVINAIAPETAPELWKVTITGQDFGAAQGNVSFAGVNSPAISSWTNTVIECVIPADIGSSITPVNVVVTAAAGAGAPYAYTVITTYYVDVNNGDDANPGTVEEPFKTITYAIDTAGEGDAINIAEGIYTGNAPADNGTKDLAETFPLEPKDGMMLRGGFQEGFQDNDPQTFITEINPEGNSGAIYIYRIVPMNKEKNGVDNISLVGLDIINGSSDEGGGIDCLNFASTLLVLECEVSNCNSVNFSGGGLYIHNSNFYMSDSNVSGNNSNFVGGGLVINYSQVTITNSFIDNNNAVLAGGGIYLSNNSTLNLTDSTVQSNTSEGSDGGGIYSGGNSDLTITGSTIYNNTADSYGGGIAYYDSSGTLTVTDSQVTGNHGDYGGGIYLYGAEAQISNSTIDGNDSGYHGGGFWIADDCTVTVDTCTVSDNWAARDGAGIYAEEDSTLQIHDTSISGNSGNVNYWGGGLAGYDITLTMTGCSVTGNNTVSSGGGLCLYNCQGTITDTTIANNSAGAGGGGIRISNYSNMNFTNCRITGNSCYEGSGGAGGGVYSNEAYSTFTNCLIANNYSVSNGGGFCLEGTGSDFNLYNSTVDGNATAGNTSGGGIYYNNDTSINIWNSNFTNNIAMAGSAIFGDVYGTINYCNVWNNIVNQNIGQFNCIAVDPLYTGAINQGWTVADTSLIINAGDPAYAGVLINGSWKTQLSTPDVTPLDIGFHYPFP